MENIAILLGVSTSFDPHISPIVHFVVDSVAKLVFIWVALEAATFLIQKIN